MSKAIPRRFYISIRNNHELFALRKRWGTLTYYHRIFLDEEEIHRSIIVEPSTAQWRSFARTIDEIGIWHWDRSYPNPGIIGGNKWEIDIAIGGKSVSSRGDCSYPGNGVPKDSIDSVSGEFSDLIAAVRGLIGELPFL